MTSWGRSLLLDRGAALSTVVHAMHEVRPMSETPQEERLPAKPKLLDQVRYQARLEHLAQSTEDAYVGWIRRYIFFHNKRHPRDMGAAEVTAFLTHLAVVGHVAASTQNQALSALLFLYRKALQADFGWLDQVVRARKPKRLPVVFTPEEEKGNILQIVAVRVK